MQIQKKIQDKNSYQQPCLLPLRQAMRPDHYASLQGVLRSQTVAAKYLSTDQPTLSVPTFPAPDTTSVIPLPDHHL